MTEQTQPHNPNRPLQSYEDLRDSARGEAGVQWKAADREEAQLRRYYEQLRDDPRYSAEYKSELAWEAYRKAKEKIISGREQASEQLASDAATYHRQSIPMPGGEGPITQDPQKIIIGQNEANRISKKVDRISESASGPFRPDKRAILREEYARGLEMGGTMGGAVCRGVVAAADECGIDVDMVVDSFRKPRHRELIERAQHAEYLQQYLGKRLSEPPFAEPASEKARISGIWARAEAAEEPSSVRAERKGPLPRKTQSHISKGYASFPVPAADEVSKQRNPRTKRKG